MAQCLQRVALSSMENDMSRLSRLIQRVTNTAKHQTKATLSKAGFKIGDHTYGVPIVRSWGEGANLRIGKYCSIADKVEIFLGGNHRVDWVTTYPFFSELGWYGVPKPQGLPSTKGDVVIGNDVWLASGCTIMSGVKLGDGCVVAAGAMVTKDVAPYQIVGGNPARVIGSRFNQTQIEQLLSIQWWHWGDEKVRRFIPLLMSPNTDEFIAQALASS